MDKRIVFLFGVVLASSYAVSQASLDPDTSRLCAEVKQVALPAEDIPTPSEATSLQGCVSEDLYFGFGQPADPVKARKCAYTEIDKDNVGIYGGKSMLMMIYANGKGADRNFDVALKLACETKSAPLDTAGRVHKLVRLKNAHWIGTNFDLCEYSSEHSMYEKCAIQQERFDRIKRDEKLNAIIAHWTPDDKQAFLPLKTAAEMFFKAHAAKESDLEATIEVHEEAFLQDQFVEALANFEKGDLPKYSPEEFRKAEAEMHGMFIETQSGKISRWGTATPAGIAITQETWLLYRDAWIDFGRHKYPSVTADSWRTWATLKRLEMLEKFSR